MSTATRAEGLFYQQIMAFLGHPTQMRVWLDSSAACRVFQRQGVAPHSPAGSEELVGAASLEGKGAHTAQAWRKRERGRHWRERLGAQEVRWFQRHVGPYGGQHQLVRRAFVMIWKSGFGGGDEPNANPSGQQLEEIHAE